ncbi:MAG: TylF/MycF/NovP-related O-methyltransferase [Pseudomonadota bacterium]
MSDKKEEARLKWIRRIRKTYRNLTTPLAIVFITYSQKIHPAYEMTWSKRMKLGWRFMRNFHKIRSGTSWRAHLVMAMRVLETPPDVEGCIVECGCWKGGATVNLSLIAAITGRTLKVYDSFEGLPPPEKGDPVAERAFKNGFVAGAFSGSLDEVKGNVERLGDISVCEFHRGWFADTLPHHDGPIALAFWDVDFYASLHDCLINLWPWIVEDGYVCMDEYRNVPYCSVFYSEKYWDKYFSTVPPGLVGIGTGVQVGMVYTDHTLKGMGPEGQKRMMGPESVAICTKGTRAIWEYYPDEIATSSDKPQEEQPQAAT